MLECTSSPVRSRQDEKQTTEDVPTLSENCNSVDVLLRNRTYVTVVFFFSESILPVPRVIERGEV
jgi:hypothetical protein